MLYSTLHSQRSFRVWCRKLIKRIINGLYGNSSDSATLFKGRHWAGLMPRSAIMRYALDKPTVSISQDKEGIGASGDAGFIGTDLLRRFTVILDYHAHKMKLIPNAHFKEPYEVDMSGLELWTEANNFKKIKIKRVQANFPAARAGLREGDEIVSVNDHPASEFDIDRLVRMFKQVGKVYRLKVRRSDQVITTKLKMRRMI